MPSRQQGPKGKNWCFTLNNYTPADIDRLSEQIPGVEYLIFGKEVGSSGTPHLQGTVCFASRKRLQQVNALLGQCHCSLTRSLPQSIEYCKKDGEFTEWGTAPSQPGAGKGRRNDLDEFKESVKAGVTDMKELRELHSTVCAQFPRFVKEYVDDCREEICVTAYPLRKWQEELNQTLNRSPDPREIIFIVDRVGNQGKSWFTRYYCELHDNAQIIIPGKKADMAYVAREDCRVYFFDTPRSKQGDFIQYDFLEEMKNGYFFSPKYESRIKKIATPHIVVCMNEYPDMEKLSADRYKVISLT